MGKYKAIICGAGRMGVGFGTWGPFPYCYVHADAYNLCKERVELLAVVDPIEERLHYAERKYSITPYTDIEKCLNQVRPDIVSICTGPEDRDFIKRIPWYVKGIFCEKPWVNVKQENGNAIIQVDYCRRFDKVHRIIGDYVHINQSKPILTVWAKDEIHTRCHFEDLAKWWNATLVYQDNTGEVPGTNTYKVDFGKFAVEFRNGGIQGDFMLIGLSNLIDAIECKDRLLSPAY